LNWTPPATQSVAASAGRRQAGAPAVLGSRLHCRLSWARGCRMQPMKDAARTILQHREGIRGGSTPGSPTASSRASTPSSRPPRPRLAVTARSATQKPSYTSWPASLISSYPLETAKSPFFVLALWFLRSRPPRMADAFARFTEDFTVTM
jgi:hypothetical protein